MKIIDEKARLFGKINIIDFLVVLFFLCFAPMFYFGHKIFYRPSVTTKDEVKVEKELIIVDVDMHLILKNLSPPVANLISVGDREWDSYGQMIGEILEVSKIESNFVTIKLSETYAITKEDVQRKQVMVRIRIRGALVGNDMMYKGNIVKIGSIINFKTSEYEAEGTIIPEPIIQIEKISKPGFIPITLDVLFTSLSPEVVNLISVGDFEVNKDGDSIAKVLSIGTIEPSTYKIDLGSGNYITKTDPQKKQLLVKMEILGGVEGNAFYFRGKRIALDSGVEFNTDKYKVEGVITREPVPIKKIDKKWLLLKVKFTYLLPELVKVIKEGDEEIDNISGDLLARIVKTESMPSKTVIQDNRELIAINHPINKDVVLLIKASCIRAQKGLFFKGIPVKIGNSISLQTNKYDIFGQILKIEEIND